jgi:regulator of sirC expression with transglutaminase-like and TPR domain
LDARVKGLPMQAITSIQSIDTLSDGQRSALVRLLADDDPEVFRQIHETILAQGPAARVWLEAHRLSEDARTRRRVRSLIEKLDADAADNAFLGFCLTRGVQLDVEEGLWLLARTRYPDIHLEAYRALLDGYAEEARSRVGDLTSTHRVLGTLNRFLFIQLGFRGNNQEYYDPDNSYLNRVMDRRTGNPISLSALYLAVCRRLQLPVAGVGLPGHFLCRYQDATHEIYVDPFNGGRFLTRTDCVHQLVRANCSLREDYLGPISPWRMLLRAVNNLHQIYQQRGETEHSLRMKRYLLALTKGPSRVWPGSPKRTPDR